MKLRIKVEFNHIDDDGDKVLEIRFLRGETLLHNVFYDVNGLSDDTIVELKHEAIAKFCELFPEISAKDIMKGFDGVDEKMYQLYRETFNPRGAGRKKGKKIGKIKPPTVSFNRRVTQEEKEFLDECLKKYRESKGTF